MGYGFAGGARRTMRPPKLRGSAFRSFLRILGATAGWLFLGLALAETYDTHRARFRNSWLSMAHRQPVGARPLSRDCVDSHPWEPGICALDATERAAVEWLRAEFPPDRLPIIYSDQTVSRIRMRYYARTPWMRRLETHCVLYYSANRELTRAWAAGPRSVLAGVNAILALPRSAAALPRFLDLSAAIAACRELPPAEAAAPADADEVLDRCRATPPRFDSRIEVLGLGGITVEMTADEPEAGMDTTLAARAFLVTAGTSIESVALLLKGPDEIERTQVRRPGTAAFSYELAHGFALPQGRSSGTWTLTACMVDSEGFATTAATRARVR